jgi:hypothetical protein
MTSREAAGRARPEEGVTLKISAGQRFAAALAVYLLWVAALAVLAWTSAWRPGATITPARPPVAPVQEPTGQ